VRDSTGTPVTGYGFVMADGESTGPGESMWYSSNQPLNQIIDPGAPPPCTGGVSGIGTGFVTCTGSDTPPPQYGALILQANAPTVVSASLQAGGQESVMFGVVTSKITLNKSIQGRVRPTDSFDIRVTSPEGTQAGFARTGPANSATTGELVVLPRVTGAAYTLSEEVTPGSGTFLSDYGQSWACTLNGVPQGGLAGPGTSRAVAPVPGDVYVCTVTNTQLPADLVITKTPSVSPLQPGQLVSFDINVNNKGPSRATDVIVTETLPPELTFVSADPACTVAGQVVTCRVETLNSGDSTSFEVTAYVGLSAEEEIVNTASVTSDTPDPVPPDNTTTVRVPVAKADLAIEKSVTPDTLIAGAEAEYTLVITNNGPDAAMNTTVTDTLPEGQTWVSGDPACAPEGPLVTCVAGTLQPGDQVTYRITVEIGASVDEPLENTAKVTSTTPDPVPENNEDTAIVPVKGVTDLKITKMASNATPSTGSQVMYTLVITNNGPSDATGVTVTDPGAAGLTLVAATPTQGTCSLPEGKISCELGKLAARGSAQVLVTANVAQEMSGQPITNKATVTGDQEDPDPRNNEDPETVTPGPGPESVADILIDKNVNASRVTVGQRLTYTIVATNNGPSAAPDVRVVDTFGRPARVRSVETTQGTCTTTPPVTCTLGPLAAGASATITIMAVPQESGTLRNSVTTTHGGIDPNPRNNVSKALTRVAKPALRITKEASRRSVRAGGRITYTIRVRNPSSVRVRKVKVCDRLPAGLSYMKSNPRAKLSRGRVCWNAGTLRARRSKTYKLTARALPGANGRKTNVVTANSPEAKTARAKRTVRIRGGALRVGGVTG
jgi:uncharacterized repeat protein (TIGR01451 family)